MPHPMKIEGASAEIGGLGSEGKVRLKGNLNANISNRQGQEIFQQVNHNLGKHPNHQNSANLPQNNTEHVTQTNGEQFPQDSENTVIKSNGNGRGNAYGHGRGRGRGGENNPKPQNNQHQPADLIVQNQTSNNNLIDKPINNDLAQKPTNQVNENLTQTQTQIVNTNSIQLQNNASNSHGKPNNWESNHGFQNRNDNRGHNNPHHLNNQSNNFVNVVVKQVFQHNDIHLSNNDVRRLVEQHNSQTQNSLSPKLKSLLQNINERTLNFLESSAKFTGKTAHQLATDISRQFHEQINTVKNNLLQNVDLNAKHFNQTNIHEKMHIAIELMPKHLSANEALNLQKHTSQEVLNGFLLTRGLIIGDEKSADIRNLINFKPMILPIEVSLTALRDVGQIVKILISNAANAKNIANLDFSVQKFVRLLIANNEIGVLLATVNLARQVNSEGVTVNRAIALVKIYELISRLMLAGEKAMKAAEMQVANKNTWQSPEPKLSFSKTENIILENEEKFALNSKTYATGAETTLRQFLEFNPNSAFDNSTSSFFNSDDSRQAQKDFSALYHQDIEQWLKSGNHRLVKDYDFEKPVGIVVERNSEGYFSANKIRIVLVRDSSVQGWHVLKSILVK